MEAAAGSRKPGRRSPKLSSSDVRDEAVHYHIPNFGRKEPRQMSARLAKPVSRRLEMTVTFLGKPRQVEVTIAPAGQDQAEDERARKELRPRQDLPERISFRLQGCKTEVWLPLKELYWEAV